MANELADLSRERNLAMQRVARRAAAMPNVGDGENDLEGSVLSESSHDDDNVEIGNVVVKEEAVEDVPGFDDIDDDENDILANNEIYESLPSYYCCPCSISI